MMIKKENEITDRGKLDQIINDSLYCHLACSLDDQPYIVPLAFGYDVKYIYLHTSFTGKKNDILKQNPNVSLCFESEVSLIQDKDQACNWTFHFQSVIVSGIIEEITISDHRTKALAQIMSHYSDQKWEFPEKSLIKTKLWRIKLLTISGKQLPAK